MLDRLSRFTFAFGFHDRAWQCSYFSPAFVGDTSPDQLDGSLGTDMKLKHF